MKKTNSTYRLEGIWTDILKPGTDDGQTDEEIEDRVISKAVRVLNMSERTARWILKTSPQTLAYLLCSSQRRKKAWPVLSHNSIPALGKNDT